MYGVTLIVRGAFSRRTNDEPKRDSILACDLNSKGLVFCDKPDSNTTQIQHKHWLDKHIMEQAYFQKLVSSVAEGIEIYGDNYFDE